nr:PREDICTED: protein yippee-like isoform X1 [Daucus carota subsp. sativus]
MSILASIARPIWLFVMISSPRSLLVSLRVYLRKNSFHCRHGKAYLFDKVENVTVGEKEQRMMMTGMHIVVDIFCVTCGSIVGWKYESAYEKSQKYKEGKYILERFKVLGPDGSGYPVVPDAQLAGSDGDE